MGLIKAGLGAVGSTLADQWKEFFYCDSLDKEVLVVKGQKKVGGRSSNTKGSDNVITSGSGIAVADGQCMIIVEQGKIVEVCAEPGDFTYDASTEPSIFNGKLSESIKETFKTIGKRFVFGGDAAKDQRVYYFNTKEIMDNKYGTPTPIPFRVVDKNIGLDMDIAVRCNGTFSFKIQDPILFYTNVCGNVSQSYTRYEISEQLKTELLTAMQVAFAKISAQGVRYSELPSHTMEMSDILNDVLSNKWKELRGITIVSFGINSVNANKEDEDMIKELQKNAVMRNTSMAAATLVSAQAEAMKMAASNENGAINGFLGMGMANQSGGVNAQNLFQMSEKNNASNKQNENTWTCSCGASNTGKFCQECGKKRHENNTWTCSCGVKNTGKFCCECGNKKPESSLYKCANCGFEIENASKMPKFCPECGKVM